MSGALRVLSGPMAAAEAARLEARAKALSKFQQRYSHNPGSQRAMVGALRRLARTFSDGLYNEKTFPWEVLVDDDLTWRMWSGVAGGVARNTAIRDASALHVMLECLLKAGLLDEEQHARAREFDTKGGGQIGDEPGHWLSPDDVGAILRMCATGAGTPVTRVRDLALLFTLAGSGVRRNEVSGMRLVDLHLAEGRIWLRSPKGGRPRSAIVHPAAVEAITQWIEVRGREPGALFVPVSRSRALVHRGPLSDHQVWKVVRRRAAEAGYADIAPHDLRRFFISNLLNTTDLVLVSRIAGHVKVSTTAKYDKRPEAQQRAAVATLSLPPLGTFTAESRPAGGVPAWSR